MYSNYSSEFKKFWEECPEKSAHIDDERAEKYKKNLVPTDYLGQHVVDYGCGGGYLGLQLLPYVKSYTGLDISQRSIDSASERLKDFPKSRTCQC